MFLFFAYISGYLFLRVYVHLVVKWQTLYVFKARPEFFFDNVTRFIDLVQVRNEFTFDVRVSVVGMDRLKQYIS